MRWSTMRNSVRAQKIVALEEGEPVQAKHEPMPAKKEKAA